ncbi:MAG: NADH-quinone oxidoreductase subunit C [Bdellovibrionales bacterium]|nr:NADH-quinone oxidoreductase subunit C [Bdellovibrionales bacterium]
MQETGTKLGESKCPELLEAFPSAILSVEDYLGDLTVSINASEIRPIVRFLKETPSQCYEFLMDLFGMDYEGYARETPARFAVVYGFYSYSRKARLRLKAFVTQNEIDSVHDIYKAANWFEREVWDMFGIQFKGHPNLKRILCHHEFKGHALRKDFPSNNYQRLRTALPSTEL